MRTGWSLKDAGAVLAIHERRVTQSLDPALDKVAKLMRTDPVRTMQSLLDAINRLEPMTPEELDVRERMNTGRINRRELGQ